jgi:hypothetical protein
VGGVPAGLNSKVRCLSLTDRTGRTPGWSGPDSCMRGVPSSVPRREDVSDVLYFFGSSMLFTVSVATVMPRAVSV